MIPPKDDQRDWLQVNWKPLIKNKRNIKKSNSFYDDLSEEQNKIYFDSVLDKEDYNAD